MGLKIVVIVSIGLNRTGTTWRYNRLYLKLKHRFNHDKSNRIFYVTKENVINNHKKYNHMPITIYCNSIFTQTKNFPDLNTKHDRINRILELKEVLPEAKIILFTRSMEDSLKSFYYKRLKEEGYTKTYDDYVNEYGKGMKEYFELNDLIELIKDNFEHTFICKYNRFKDNIEIVTKELFNFIKGDLELSDTFLKIINYDYLNYCQDDKDLEKLRLQNKVK